MTAELSIDSDMAVSVGTLHEDGQCVGEKIL